MFQHRKWSEFIIWTSVFVGGLLTGYNLGKNTSPKSATTIQAVAEPQPWFIAGCSVDAQSMFAESNQTAKVMSTDLVAWNGKLYQLVIVKGEQDGRSYWESHLITGDIVYTPFNPGDQVRIVWRDRNPKGVELRVVSISN